MSTHPWPAVRLQEISSWAESKQYALLLAGDYQSALAVAPLPTGEGEFAAATPAGEDIEEYVKDVGKAAGEIFKGFFKRLGQPRNPDKN